MFELQLNCLLAGYLLAIENRILMGSRFGLQLVHFVLDHLSGLGHLFFREYPFGKTHSLFRNILSEKQHLLALLVVLIVFQTHILSYSYIGFQNNFYVHECSDVKDSFSTYLYYYPDGFLWLNLCFECTMQLTWSWYIKVFQKCSINKARKGGETWSISRYGIWMVSCFHKGRSYSHITENGDILSKNCHTFPIIMKKKLLFSRKIFHDALPLLGFHKFSSFYLDICDSSFLVFWKIRCPYTNNSFKNCEQLTLELVRLMELAI